MVHLPGSSEPFSLLKYKEALGKTFARITLYLGYNEASAMHTDDADDNDDDFNDGDVNDAISSPFDLNYDRNDFLATSDCANPALNSLFMAIAANNDVYGLPTNRNNITERINTSHGAENRDELILPISGSHDRLVIPLVKSKLLLKPSILCGNLEKGAFATLGKKQ